MKFIIAGLGNFYRSWKLAEEAIPIADELGYYGVVFPDHYMWDRAEMPDRNSTIDAWVALSYLAAKTSSLKLGTLVSPIPFRPPGTLAKMVSSLDVISSGRAILGVGAGWSRTEFEGYSEWTDGKTRVDKTDEGIRLIMKLWQEPKVDFKGRFYSAKGAVLDPKPVQKPYPPLLFGGLNPRMLRLAGRYGDLCYIPPWIQTPFIKAKTIVDREARKIGRQNQLVYGAGSPGVFGKFDMKAVEKDIQLAEENGCGFYVVPFPQEDYTAKMREFAKDLLPSYSSDQQLLTQ